VDNEGAGRKKSKICCIYHKPRAFDESSDESSDESDDSEAEGHEHGHVCDGHEPNHSRSSRNVRIRNVESSEVVQEASGGPKNAYEAPPSSKDKGKGKGKGKA